MPHTAWPSALQLQVHPLGIHHHLGTCRTFLQVTQLDILRLILQTFLLAILHQVTHLHIPHPIPPPTPWWAMHLATLLAMPLPIRLACQAILRATILTTQAMQLITPIHKVMLSAIRLGTVLIHISLSIPLVIPLCYILHISRYVLGGDLELLLFACTTFAISKLNVFQVHVNVSQGHQGPPGRFTMSNMPRES